MKHRKFIILDRDGVINHDSSEYIKTPSEWKALPDSLEAIGRLTKNNWNILIASNQSGIARGLFDIHTLHKIHKKMQNQIQEAGGYIEAIFFCPSQDNTHPDRKPNPGMLLDIIRRLQQPPESFIMVGDSSGDIRAAQAAGIRPILVLTGNGQETVQKWQEEITFSIYADLASTVDHLLITTKFNDHTK